MQGWVRKEACLEAAKSLRIKAWLKTWGESVPCRIQKGPLNDYHPEPGEHYECRFHPGGCFGGFSLNIHEHDIKVDHPLFRHSVPIGTLGPMKAILRHYEERQNDRRNTD
jgi:hypothetical protein